MPRYMVYADRTDQVEYLVTAEDEHEARQLVEQPFWQGIQFTGHSPTKVELVEVSNAKYKVVEVAPIAERTNRRQSSTAREGGS
jgi:hypothetical protein